MTSRTAHAEFHRDIAQFTCRGRIACGMLIVDRQSCRPTEGE